MSSEWGSGVWIIAVVLAFNLTCIPLWFLLNHLKRSANFEQKRLQTFLHLLKQRDVWRERESGSSDLHELIERLEAQLAQAEHMGALWGRKHTTMGKLTMTQICETYPEDGQAILSAMQR